MESNERRMQVAQQCRAVAYMASALAQVYADYERFFGEDGDFGLVEVKGEDSAELMEILGDILNGMEAVDDDSDEWMTPVFETAHKMWPARRPESTEIPSGTLMPPDLDGIAFRWLLAIERLDWKTTSRQKGDGQIRIRICPHGNLRREDNSKVSPMVFVAVTHPAAAVPVKGFGNSLMDAVREVWSALNRIGVYLPPPDTPEVTVDEWRAARTARNGS